MNSVVGFHGKVPSRGDFVHNGLPDTFLERWDQWLQESIATSKAALGGSWLDLYLKSPIWRFVVSAGVIDASAWCGVVMPSVDRVNRYFPLTIAANISAEQSVFGVSSSCREWFVSVEALLLQALDDDYLDIQEFSRAVSEQSVPDWMPTQNPTAVEINANGESRFSLDENNDLSGCAATLLDHHHKQQHGGYSLWWTDGSERVAAQGRVFSQLPSSERFVDLLRDAD